MFQVLEIEYRKATAGTKVECRICHRKVRLYIHCDVFVNFSDNLAFYVSLSFIPRNFVFIESIFVVRLPKELKLSPRLRRKNLACLRTMST